MTADAIARALELWDRDQMARIPIVYTQAFDAGDWVTVRACFSDDAVVEGALGALPADESLARSRALSSQCVRMMHFITSQRVELHGDRGFVESSVTAYNWMEEPAGAAHPANSLVGARYLDTMARTASGWRIAHRRLERDWSVGEEPMGR